jgi:hypothetical protein
MPKLNSTLVDGLGEKQLEKWQWVAVFEWVSAISRCIYTM